MKIFNYKWSNSLFAMPAVNFAEIKKEAKATILQRCQIAIEKAQNMTYLFIGVT